MSGTIGGFGGYSNFYGRNLNSRNLNNNAVKKDETSDNNQVFQKTEPCYAKKTLAQIKIYKVTIDPEKIKNNIKNNNKTQNK